MYFGEKCASDLKQAAFSKANKSAHLSSGKVIVSLDIGHDFWKTFGGHQEIGAKRSVMTRDDQLEVECRENRRSV